MAVKKQFSVALPNRPGQLAKLTRVLARGKVNLLAVNAPESLEFGPIRLLVDDAAKAREVLKKGAFEFTTTDVVVVELPNEPGALSEATRRLAQAGLSIEYAYATASRKAGTALCIFRVDDAKQADTLLKA